MSISYICAQKLKSAELNGNSAQFKIRYAPLHRFFASLTFKLHHKIDKHNWSIRLIQILFFHNNSIRNLWFKKCSQLAKSSCKMHAINVRMSKIFLIPVCDWSWAIAVFLCRVEAINLSLACGTCTTSIHNIVAFWLCSICSLFLHIAWKIRKWNGLSTFSLWHSVHSLTNSNARKQTMKFVWDEHELGTKVLSCNLIV